jgi:hypothetical protein
MAACSVAARSASARDSVQDQPGAGPGGDDGTDFKLKQLALAIIWKF